jgi:hypothetical protein
MPQVYQASVRITTTALTKSMVDVGAELAGFLRETIGLSVSDIPVGGSNDIPVKISGAHHTIRIYRPAARGGAFRRISLTKKLVDSLILVPESLMRFDWDGHTINVFAEAAAGSGSVEGPSAAQLMPDELINWSGAAKGGVHVLFAPDAGNPAGRVLETELIRRINQLAQGMIAGELKPRIVLLAGGAGNGKTHAVEAFLRLLVKSESFEMFAEAFLKRARAGRMVELSPADADSTYFVSPLTKYTRITVVQDASETDKTGNAPHKLLLEQVQHALNSKDECLVVCANRGVLYAAAREADRDQSAAAGYLAEVIRCLDPLSVDRDCWPMKEMPDSFLWPLDIESVCEAEPGRDPAALALLDALDESEWVDLNVLGQGHPLAVARSYLKSRDFRKALVRLMRDYEMATGKNLTFRKLFSACSYLFSGGRLNGELRPMKKAAMLKTDERHQAVEEEGSLAFAAYEQSLPFLLFPAHPDVSEFRKRLQRVKDRDKLRFLDVIVDRVEQLRERIEQASRHPGSAIFADVGSSWSAYTDPCRVKLAQREQDWIIKAGLSGALMELPQLVSIKLQHVVALTREKCDPNTVRMLEWLARCELELGREMENSRRYELEWFARWITRYAAMLTARSLALEVMRSGGTLSPTAAAVEQYRALIHDEERRDGFVRQALSVMFGADIADTDRHVISLASGLCRPPSPIKSAARFEINSQPSGILAELSGMRPPASCLVLDIMFDDNRTYRVPLTLRMHGMIVSMANGLLPGSLPPAVRASIDVMRMRQDGYVLRTSKKAKLVLPGNSPVTIQRDLAGAHVYFTRK